MCSSKGHVLNTFGHMTRTLITTPRSTYNASSHKLVRPNGLSINTNMLLLTPGSQLHVSHFKGFIGVMGGHCCRLLRHDMVAELCDSASRFQQAGGIGAALPKGATSGRASLRKGEQDLNLYVYGNVEIKDLITTRFGAGIQFQVVVQTSSLCVCSDGCCRVKPHASY